MESGTFMKIKYIGRDSVSLKNGKVYEGRRIKHGYYGVVDETGEEYAFPPTLFEVIEG